MSFDFEKKLNIIKSLEIELFTQVVTMVVSLRHSGPIVLTKFKLHEDLQVYG